MSRSAWLAIELNLAHLDIVLAVLFGDGSRHGALLRFRADRLVVLLVASGIEIINDVLVAVLHLDDGLALVGLFEIALGTGNGAFERFLFLLVFGAGAHNKREYH